MVYSVTARVDNDAVGEIVNTANLEGDGCTPDNCTSVEITPLTPPPSAPTPVPVDSRAMLALLALAVMTGFWRNRAIGKKPR